MTERWRDSGSPADEPPVTVWLRDEDGERIEGFANMRQLALWLFVRLYDRTLENGPPVGHQSRELVRRALRPDSGALTRFLVRCGEEEAVIVQELASSGVDVRAVIAAARDELAVMTEREPPHWGAGPELESAGT